MAPAFARGRARRDGRAGSAGRAGRDGSRSAGRAGRDGSRSTEPARWRADLALVVAAFFFGTTFLVVQDAVEEAEPVPFVAVRFLLGAAVLGALSWRRPASPGAVRHGMVAGAALAAGYVLQTVGLQYTTPATSAFLTYLLIVLVPLLGWLALGRRPPRATAAGVALALAGMVLLTGSGTGGAGAGTDGGLGGLAGLGRGELLTLGGAVAFAVHMLILGETAGRHDPLRFTSIQLATVGAACAVPGLVTGGPAGLALPRSALGAAAFTGVLATALTFAGMVFAQRTVSPTRAALILLLEPVFALLMAWVAGDPPTAATLTGGGLILLAVVVAEVLPTAAGGGHAGGAAAPAAGGVLAAAEGAAGPSAGARGAAVAPAEGAAGDAASLVGDGVLIPDRPGAADREGEHHGVRD
ncbi:MAG TPA: DMT family transporter [Acidimicrobiales bacterium]